MPLRVRRVLGGCVVYDTDIGEDVSEIMPRHLAEQECDRMIRERQRQFNTVGDATAGHKVSKTSVDYSKATNMAHECGACKHFQRASGTCAIVAGHIEPDMWCQRFQARI